MMKRSTYSELFNQLHDFGLNREQISERIDEAEDKAKTCKLPVVICKDDKKFVFECRIVDEKYQLFIEVPDVQVT